MLHLLAATLTVLYYACLVLLALSSVERLALLLRRPRTAPPPPAPLTEHELPRVLLQLPLFNEPAVAERLLRTCGALDWPRNRLTIQVLDDSTDRTREIVDRTAIALRADGLDIRVLRRPDRDGFKAGALAHGLGHSDHPFVAILDADFLPDASFLRDLLPSLQNPAIGMVQARWAHLNARQNPLTAAQAVLLDGHFRVEQPARAHQGRFFNFNGTAGIWRRAAIDDAGGWQGDTLTEDLDLSYRAQLHGWTFAYREDIAVPAELPATLQAFRSQQRRWAKGGLETLGKLFRRILAAPMRPARRLAALAHLAANANYILLATVALLMPAIAILPDAVPLPHLDIALLLTGLGGALAFAIGAQRETPFLWRLVLAPLALLLDIGISLQKAAAALEAIAGRRSAFVRTPKSGTLPRALLPGPEADHATPSTADCTAPNAPQPFPVEPWMALWCALGAAAALAPAAPRPILAAFLIAFALAFGTVGLAARTQSAAFAQPDPAVEPHASRA